MHDFTQIAQNYISGAWIYDAENKTLKRNFANDQELLELKLINQEGYLAIELKLAFNTVLADVIATGITGAFGDDDIFNGDISENEVFYNIELYQVSDATIAALQQIPNVSITK